MPSVIPMILKDRNLPWEKILHLGTPVTFAAKQIITNEEGRLSDGAYYIRKGRVRLSYLSPLGHEKVLINIGQHSLFNDVPTVQPGSGCIFTFVENTSTVFFKKSLLLTPQFVSNYPEIMLNWMDSFAWKLNNFFAQLCNVGLLDSFANVCRLLYSMAIYHVEQGKIVPHFSQQECASILGIHRGSWHKAIARLKHEGIIGNYSRKELEVFDLKRLSAYSEE